MTSAIGTHTLIIVFQLCNLSNKTFVDIEEGDIGFYNDEIFLPTRILEQSTKNQNHMCRFSSSYEQQCTVMEELHRITTWTRAQIQL